MNPTRKDPQGNDIILVVNNLEQVILSTISDLSVNISAGFFGATFILPITTRKSSKISISLLIFNLLFAIIFLLISLNFRLNLK